MVILCDYAGCERAAVCRITTAAGLHVHYCDRCLITVESRLGTRQVEALHGNDPARVEANGRPLTGIELEVLKLIADGLPNHEIADELYRSPEAVDTHLRHILDKLGARSRAHAVSIAYRQRLLTLEPQL